MLEIAKTRLNNVKNVNDVLGDYTIFFSHVKFDIITSALSLHHLSDSNKLELYKNTYGCEYRSIL